MNHEASIASSSKEEEVSDKSTLPSIVFSDGMRYRRFSKACRAAEPTNRKGVVVVCPLYDLRDNVLPSAWVAFGHRSAPGIHSVDNRSKYFIDS